MTADATGKQLFQAADQGDIAGLRMHLERARPSDVEYSGYNGRTPLLAAAFRKNVDAMGLLLTQGRCDANRTNHAGKAALMLACVAQPPSVPCCPN